MNDLILHHYPQSPVAEKVRTALGLKGCRWRSVTIPRIPPKPDLVALTGGYRRTPVLQIGADIYCDSQRILREIDRRFPNPPFFADGRSGQGWGLTRWVDEILFPLAVRVVIGHQARTIDEAFLTDRADLYFGPGWSRESILASVPHAADQLFLQLAWLDEQLARGGSFLEGQQAGLLDVECWYLVWFLRGRYEEGPRRLDRLANISAWEPRMAAIGHGGSEDMGSGEALVVARQAVAEAVPEGADPLPGWTAGVPVQVLPDGAGNDPPVAGVLLRADRDEIAIGRSDARAGDVVVHFPAVGYRLQAK